MAHSHTASLADFHAQSPRASLYDDKPLPPPPPSTTPPSVHPSPVKKQAALAQISVPASALPLSYSPTAVSLSLADKTSPRLVEPTSRPLSLVSLLPLQPRGPANLSSSPFDGVSSARQEDRSSSALAHAAQDRDASIDFQPSTSDTPGPASDARRPSTPTRTRHAYEHTIAHVPEKSAWNIDLSEHFSPDNRPEDGSMHVPQAPNMLLRFDGVQRTLSDGSLTSDSARSRDRRPKSPGGRLGSFYRWAESPTTTLSDRSLSPLPSPRLEKPLTRSKMEGSAIMARLTPPGLDIQKANSPIAQYFDNPDTPILLGSPETNAHVRELEKELAQVSQELAGSIRREMELEDEVERLRAEAPSRSQSEAGRRSSDYFSDSGASSARYPVSDPDAKLEQMEQKLRKAEQDKAQLKVDMASKLQSELGRRRDLEEMIHGLEEQLQKRFGAEDSRGEYEERMSELEASLDDSRRRLAQEREAKDSFDDLYSATRSELEQHKSERDNLRDEIVPQLKARLEGMEAETADTRALMYENTRMQQELAALRDRSPMFSSITEEDDLVSPVFGPKSGGLSRSGSLARNSGKRGVSLTRSGSMRERSDSGQQRAGPHVSVEGVKEIEDQRDALHMALKLLISRYEKQQREHARAIKNLSGGRQQPGRTASRRTAYHEEVSFLKEEVTTLRKRTDDALEQKWQYEKGLSGLKMDLDRADQETRGLRSLLQGHDVVGQLHSPADLGDNNDGAAGSLKVIASEAESERDQARQLAEEYHHRALSTPAEGAGQDLFDSAQRMDELANQLDRQVQANTQLRSRLAEAVTKGEQEQRESTRRIEEMQKRLAGMEDSVLAAAQHSEATLGSHEAEVRRMEEARSPALQRLHISIPDVRQLSVHSPLVVKSPRLDGGGRHSGTSLRENGRTGMLERQVRELEGLLKEAEDDVQTVVRRVNKSQLEVAALQTERDAAMVQMRKLTGLVVAERERAEGLMG